MFCQHCHTVGHICKKPLKEEGHQPQKQKWQVKDKRKQVENEAVPQAESWAIPKKVASPSIQVGNIQVPTGNGFNDLESVSIEVKGGDLFPFLAP